MMLPAVLVRYSLLQSVRSVVWLLPAAACASPRLPSESGDSQPCNNAPSVASAYGFSCNNYHRRVDLHNQAKALFQLEHSHVLKCRMASGRHDTRLRPDAAEFVMPQPSQSLTMNNSRSRGPADTLLDDAANPAQPRNLTKSQHQQLKNTLKRLGCDFVHVDALLAAHNERVRPRYRICSVDAITQYVAHKAFSPENKHWDFRGGVWVRFVPQQSDKAERGNDVLHSSSPGSCVPASDVDIGGRGFASLEGLTAGQIACRDDDDVNFGWGPSPSSNVSRSFEFPGASGSFALPPPVDAPVSASLRPAVLPVDMGADASRSPLFHRGPGRQQRSDSGRSRSNTAETPNMTQVAHMIWGSN
jgi:hypothetical protein